MIIYPKNIFEEYFSPSKDWTNGVEKITDRRVTDSKDFWKHVQKLSKELSNDLNNMAVLNTADGNIMYKFDLAGFSENDVSVTLSKDNTLKIQAQSDNNVFKKKMFHEVELSVGDVVKYADMKDGVLTVEIERKQEKTEDISIPIGKKPLLG